MNQFKELLCGSRRLTLFPGKPVIMGILNATPDSFSDGRVALGEKVYSILSADPDIIDLGGESTRPGAKEISVEEELDRILPVLRKIRSVDQNVLISIDTRKSAVAKAAMEEGADIINDVSCLHFDPEMAETVAEYSAGLILNHSRGTPDTMNDSGFLNYRDGIAETVCRELEESVSVALKAGVKRESIILDPGFGFAKNTEQNLELIRNPELLLALGYPLLSGPSRKRFVGELTGEPEPGERDFGTCGAVIASYLSGYSIFRVHNVKAARDSLAVFSACSKNISFFSPKSACTFD